MITYSAIMFDKLILRQLGHSEHGVMCFSPLDPSVQFEPRHHSLDGSYPMATSIGAHQRR